MHPEAQRTLRGQTVVVKLSGKALDSPQWAKDVVYLQRQGARPIVVHGAGKQIDALSARMGLQPQFVEGLRVTDAPTLEVAEMVLHRLGKEAATAIGREGGKALGLSGRDSVLLVAQPRDPALGLVGRIVGVNTDALDLLCSDGFVPVLNPIATGPGLQALNTNADEAAQAIAVAMGAHALLLVSDVDGVRDAHGQRIARATPASIAALKGSGAASGGMLPKLQACAEAVQGGVGMVRILASGASLLQALDAAHDMGTLVTPDPDSATASPKPSTSTQPPERT
jgi:acetylglutamate kinase